MKLEGFDSAVSAWFLGRHQAPTEPQRLGWPVIRSRRNLLIAAPTGSGKTLAAFLAAIDDLVRQAESPLGLPTATQVLYISPLKALGNDIQRNLQEPLVGIRAEAESQGRFLPEIRAQVRSGDTPPAERAAMLKKPPHILVTTPESFFLLLTSPKGREMLRPVRTVIVDEIHAMVGNKRGSHLALSLERLEALADTPPVRVGLSATQKPIAEVARFLVGVRHGEAEGEEAPIPRPCEIIDTGHVRRRDLAIEVPDSPLEAVMSGEVWTEVYNRLADLVQAHQTTLVFVNTRRLAERVSRHLSERMGESLVAAHHGSLSKEHRLDAEQRLKAGSLKVLVATASLELGIDVGAVDLVCQIGSTRSIAAFLQRVGRSGHTLHGLPKGRLFPLTRDELVECAALLDAVGREELDRLIMPDKPLEVAAQQIVAAVAREEWETTALYNLLRSAYPYQGLTRQEFDEVMEILSRGFTTRRGRTGAYVHHDAVNGRVRARKGASMAVLMNGGAIPETAAFDVVMEPTDTFIGTVDEDFAIESLPGDIFQLGNTSWRILRVETGKVRVEDAQGQPPNIPFWIGETPGRSDELSHAVSRLRETMAEMLRHVHTTTETKAATGTTEETEVPAAAPEAPIYAFVNEHHPAVRWLVENVGVPLAGALQLAEYLASAQAALGVMPTQQTLVAERFFDEGGGMQLVLHSPFGSRMNRAWGLALRKRFCRQFNFELQAAATEDAIVLSLGPTHSFPLDEVYRYLHSNTARKVLVQALLDAPMFNVRWRHNANRALAVLRRMNGKKVAPQLQRMRSDDLLALVFPDQQACLENIVGDKEVPEHPLVHQTLRDCLEEVMDIDALEGLLKRMEGGEITLVARDLREPSPLALEILNARPYAFLDDAPLEERRTRAVAGRRWLDPDTADDLGALDILAIQRVRDEARPLARDSDEAHEALMQMGLVAMEDEFINHTGPGWGEWMQALAAQGRAAVIEIPGRGDTLNTENTAKAESTAKAENTTKAWIAAEWWPTLRVLFPQAVPQPMPRLPDNLESKVWEPAHAARELVRARLEVSGPITVAELSRVLFLPPERVEAALLALEGEGYAFRGVFTPGVQDSTSEGSTTESSATEDSTSESSSSSGVAEWCERGLMARIHRYTLDKLRREIEPVSTADFMRFLFNWQRVAPGQKIKGVEGLAAVLEQLEGFEAPAAAWEREVLAARTEDYDPEWLNTLCVMGRVAWSRLTVPATMGGIAAKQQNRRAPGESKANTPSIPLSLSTVKAGKAMKATKTMRSGPVSTTPIALLNRRHLPLWNHLKQRGSGNGSGNGNGSRIRANRKKADTPLVREELPAFGVSAQARQVKECLVKQGASFFADLTEATGLLPIQVETALGELVALGCVTADSFDGLRILLKPASKRIGSRGRRGSAAHAALGISPMEKAGRWSLLKNAEATPAEATPAEALSSGIDNGSKLQRETQALETFAWVVLRRYGVVFSRLLIREPCAPPWRELLRVFRRLEARGEIRGGRFVSGVSGEQYALPEGVGSLREVRRQDKTGALISLTAADPLNLLGIMTSGPRLPAITVNRILYKDGVPVAVLEGGSPRFLTAVPASEQWVLENALLGGNITPFHGGGKQTGQ